jgi:hypothetical protein
LHGKYNEVNNGSHLLPDPKCTCSRFGFPGEYPGTFLFLFVMWEWVYILLSPKKEKEKKRQMDKTQLPERIYTSSLSSDVK